MHFTRRSFGTLAAVLALPHKAPSQTASTQRKTQSATLSATSAPPDPLPAARATLSSASRQMAAVKLARNIEPATRFEA